MYKMRFFILGLLFTTGHAISCQFLRTMYSDMACCANMQTDTCLREIASCDTSADGEICSNINGTVVVKGGVASNYVLPTASSTVLGGVKVDGTTITIANGVISAPEAAISYNDLTDQPTLFSRNYSDLTNKPTIITSYNDLTDQPALFSGNYSDLTNKPTLFDGDYNSLTNKPDLSNVGGGSNVAVDNSTIKQDENGTIYVPQTSISYNDLTDKPDPYTLPSDLSTFDASLQTVGSKFGLGVSPEASFHIALSENVHISASRFECDGTGAIIEQTSGEVSNMMSQTDCSALANYQSSVPAVSAVKKYDGYCSSSTNNNSPYNFIVVEFDSGSPDLSMTEEECRVYGESINKWYSKASFTNMPSGCFKNGGFVFFNTYQHSYSCTSGKTCLQKQDTTYDNPGTTEQERINNCRDACTDRSTPLFSGEWNFRSASFWVEPTGGQCFCGSDDAGTCATTASDYIDLYALNNPPKGCFKDSSGNHYHNNPLDDNYGVCSTTYTCLRNDEGCLVQDTNNATKPLSFISEQSAWFKQEIVVSSDRRIKENVFEIENATALLRQIEPKQYEYKDKRKWNGTTLGFIAQDVASVMPEAVKVEKGFVPNLLKRVTCTYSRNITLTMNCPELASGRVRLFVTDENGESLLDIDVREGDMVVEKVYQAVFAYGYEVDDFYTLEKSKLFALNFAATKELDARIQALEEQIKNLV